MPKILNRGLLALLLGAVMFTAVPGSVFANHSWGGYHWARTNHEFTLKLGDNVSAVWDSYLVATAIDWSASPVFEITTVTPGNAISNLRKCPPTSGRVEVCSYKYGTNGWLGVAQIWVSGKHITQGTVKINDSYFDNSRYPKYNSPPWRNMVMCQEVGHTFGLDHQDETFNNKNLGSCMDYTNHPEGGVYEIDYGPRNEAPGGTVSGDSDWDELERIYFSHGDTSTTVGQTVQSGPGKGTTRPAVNDEPLQLGTAQWGKLMRSTNGGRTELYELDLGNGHKVVTHVIWGGPRRRTRASARSTISDID